MGTDAFLDLAELSPAQIRALLRLAAELQADPTIRPLAGLNVGLLFMNPSLRTLASMQVAVNQLGGHSVVIQRGRGVGFGDTRRRGDGWHGGGTYS